MMAFYNLVLSIAAISALGFVVAAQTGAPEPCNIDYVCFGFDSSGSVRPLEFPQQVEAMKKIAEGLETTGALFAAYSMVDRARSSLVPTEEAVEVVAPFVSNAEFAAEDIMRETGPRAFQYDDISTTIKACGDALNAVDGVRVMVLLTDGYSPPYDQLPLFQGHVDMAREYSDISIVTVGTGNNPNRRLLEAVASSPMLYEPVGNFEAVADKVIGLLSDPMVCDTIEITETPTPTPTPQPMFKCRRKSCRFELNSSGAIVARSGTPRIGVVGGASEAFVRNGPQTTLISNWSPAGLRQEFSASFFKPFPLAGTYMSGVGFEVPQQNQGNFINMLRVCLPLRAYQILNDNNPPQVTENVNTNDPEDCVFFKTVFPRMTDKATQS